MVPVADQDVESDWDDGGVEDGLGDACRGLRVDHLDSSKLQSERSALWVRKNRKSRGTKDAWEET